MAAMDVVIVASAARPLGNKGLDGLDPGEGARSAGC
jgi:hypothetical protein